VAEIVGVATARDADTLRVVVRLAEMAGFAAFSVPATSLSGKTWATVEPMVGFETSRLADTRRVAVTVPEMAGRAETRVP
jgi:hypothetical protein